MNAHTAPNLSVVPQLQRDGTGRFLKGSGGRPVGAKAKVSRDLLTQVKALGPQAVDKLKEALAQGERWSVELILQHCLPRERSIELEGMTVDDISAALMTGDVSVAEAKDLMSTAKSMREFEDLDQIRAKLNELEALIADNGLPR